MKHLFLPYKLAAIAKKKGYSDDYLGIYPTNTKKLSIQQGKKGLNLLKSNNIYVEAPLYQQIRDWLYSFYKINIETRVGISGNWSGYITINKGNVQQCPISCSHFSSKRELLDHLISEAFKLI